MNADTPYRRFAPEPMETTYKSHRTTPVPPTALHIGPTLELTPDPSPPSSPHASACLRERRRFAPQLIETSRRSRRVGDPGPATRPTDKTDITPYTNHIYTTKTKLKKRHDGLTAEEDVVRRKQPTRRETEEEEVQEYLLELAAKEAERQIQEDALAAFPNSRAREGGVAHFYFRDGSSSEDSPASSPAEHERGRRRQRRKTSSVELNWWQRHMQQHAEKLAHDRGRNEEAERCEEHHHVVDVTSDSELDKMDLTVPPDAMWTTSRRASVGNQAGSAGRQTEAMNWGADCCLVGPRETVHALRGPAPESAMPDGKSQPHAKAPVNEPSDPFGRPFAALGIRPTAAQLQRIRKFVSPPMLGKELKFRRCPSPKRTKLETDHSFVHSQNAKRENRDPSGKGGLWRGFCCRSESTGGYLVPAELHPPAMMATPRTPGTPGTPREPSANEVDCALATVSDASGSSLGDRPAVDEEPTPAPDSLGDCLPGVSPPAGPVGQEQQKRHHHHQCRHRSREPKKGLAVFRGLDERLQREKARAELDEKIAKEFGDDFVTQVYNYLSLGYPATARAFDEELSRISRVSVEELSRDDEKRLANGHILLEATGKRDDATPAAEKEERERERERERKREVKNCPRWRALRIYIIEWARQHPDLDNLNPSAWGVRERRGSWAI